MKTWNRFLLASFRSLLFVLFATVCIAPGAFAQGTVDKYTVETSFPGSGVWNDLSTTGGNYIYDEIFYYQYIDGGSLPFDFSYDNQTIPAGTEIYISGGDLSFGNTPAYEGTDAGGLGNGSYPSELVYWGGYYITAGYGQNQGDVGTYGIYTQVTGSAPNQVFTIQLTNVHTNWGSGNSSQTSGIQVKLFQSNGNIQFLYQYHNLYLGGYYAESIGINGTGMPSFADNSYTTNVTSTPSSDLQFTPPIPPGQLSLQPKSINFGAAPVGFVQQVTATASSVGVSPITITNYTLTGSSDFTLVSGPGSGTVIPVGNQVQYTFQFDPSASGSEFAKFTLVTTGKDSGTQVINLSGNGLAPSVSFSTNALFHRTNVQLSDTSGVQYVGITNTGNYPLVVNSVYFIGLDAADYFISRYPATIIGPDVTDSIGVRFAPRIEGRPDASLVINTNALNTPWDTVSLFGVGILPRIAVLVQPPGTGNTVAFDSVALGDSVCQAITISNPGSDTLRIVKQLVTYGDYDFTYYPLTGSDTMILPGGSRLVNICFKPLKVGSRLASIRFYTNIPLTYENPRRDTNQFVVNVTGIGVPYGQLAVLGSLNDTAVVGTTNCITDTLRNTGQSDMTISSLAIAPPTPNFTLTGATTPFTLPPGGIQIVSLCFTATSRGLETDTLLLSGATSEKTFSEGLLLNGVGVIRCVSADSIISFGTAGLTPVGTEVESCITVTNCGDIATSYTASLPSGTGYTLVPPLTSTEVPAGGTAQFCVNFLPTAIGAAPGSVVIAGGPNPATTILGGVGAGVAATASGTLSTPVADGGCQSFDVTIMDTGNVPWTPGTGTITGANASDFTITTQATPATIAPGGTATVTINFCPTTIGTEAMTLTFPNETPVPVAGAFSYPTTANGAESGVTIKTEQDGFVLGASYPNPTNGEAAIQLTLPNEASVHVELLDATGAPVRTVFTGNLGAGTQTLPIDAKGLPSGTYFYTLTSGNVRLTRQLSLIK